jgi:ectoine hydroxylase
MKLTKEQITFYNENGYLKLENYLTADEVETLYSEFPKTIEKSSPRIILEDNGSVRSVFAPHFVNQTYSRLSRLDRFIVPAEQLIGNKVYLHQYKINTKKGLQGDWWEWHQDFPYWYFDDGIKNPELVSIMLYLQDTNASNGALLLIPKSHRSGIAKFENKDPHALKEKIKYNDHHKNKDYLSSLNSNIKFTVDHELVKRLASTHGIVEGCGKKGTVLFFHGNIFHASNTNLTPFDRDAIIITYNSVDNLPSNTQNPRPDFLVGTDYLPIEKLEKSI